MTEATTQAPIIGTVNYDQPLGWVGIGIKLSENDPVAEAKLSETIAVATNAILLTAEEFASYGITGELPEATHLVIADPKNVSFLTNLIANTYDADGTVKPEVIQQLEAGM